MNAAEFADLLEQDPEVQGFILHVYSAGFASGVGTILNAHGVPTDVAMGQGVRMRERLLNDPAVRDELITGHVASLRDKQSRFMQLRPAPLEDDA